MYLQVLTTIDDERRAEEIAKTLVERRLAACVQVIGPITSTYWWKNRVEGSREWILIIKSREELYDELEKMIRRLHSYEVPEIIAIPITRGSREYLKWIDEELRCIER